MLLLDLDPRSSSLKVEDITKRIKIFVKISVSEQSISPIFCSRNFCYIIEIIIHTEILDNKQAILQKMPSIKLI